MFPVRGLLLWICGIACQDVSRSATGPLAFNRWKLSVAGKGRNSTLK
jgi:hypothetical protein